MSVASLLLNQIRDVLQDSDATAYRWSDATLLRYLSGAQRFIVSVRPRANTVTEVHTVADTVPRRTLPANAASFVQTVSNVSAAGGNYTTPVQRTTIAVLDAVDPEWRFAAPTAPDPDRHYSAYANDPLDPKAFWLYPRPAAGRNVFITYAQLPPDVASAGATLTLGAEYDEPMIEFVLYRALSSEGRYARPDDGAKHLNNFATLLGLSAKETRGLMAQIKSAGDQGG